MRTDPVRATASVLLYDIDDVVLTKSHVFLFQSEFDSEL